MKGLKKHTHEERQRVIDQMVPLIRQKFGDNLLALAVTASFARNDDLPYSDLELTAFLKKMPESEKRGMGKIRDGLLVELIWTTEENYLKEVKEITEQWYLAGSDVLVPVINAEFIENITRRKIAAQPEIFIKHAVGNWHEVQEATAKVLNAILAENRDAMPLLACDILRHMLIVLSFLNQTPFITFAKFISQARGFNIKPAAFDSLADIIVEGEFQDFARLEKAVIEVFTQFETIFEELGVELYDDNLEIN